MKVKCLIVLFLFPLIAFAQPKKSFEKCALTLEQSPEVRGLKLGQRSGLLGGLFPNEYPEGLIQFRHRIQSDDVGVFTERITNYRRDPPEILKGIRSINLMYLDDLLASIEIDYSPEVRWQSNAHFAAAIAEQIKLPTVGWVDRISSVRLSCDDFFVDTQALLHGRLKIEKSSLRQEIGKRRAQQEQKKRVDFKP